MPVARVASPSPARAPTVLHQLWRYLRSGQPARCAILLSYLQTTRLYREAPGPALRPASGVFDARALIG
jgi:hypothetical protein